MFEKNTNNTRRFLLGLELAKRQDSIARDLRRIRLSLGAESFAESPECQALLAEAPKRKSKKALCFFILVTFGCLLHVSSEVAVWDWEVCRLQNVASIFVVSGWWTLLWWIHRLIFRWFAYLFRDTFKYSFFILENPIPVCSNDPIPSFEALAFQEDFSHGLAEKLKALLGATKRCWESSAGVATTEPWCR